MSGTQRPSMTLRGGAAVSFAIYRHQARIFFVHVDGHGRASAPQRSVRQ